MKTRLFIASILLSTSLACGGLMGGGVGSAECVEYFAVVEECAAKAEAKGSPAGKAKAEAWRKAAETARKGFEQNPMAPSIPATCEAMTAPIKNDADCK